MSSTFGLKVFAFAGGAFLAGMVGTIKAHHDVSVTPDQYIFLESAFLLAAVVLGGMGTVAGVLIGATILKLLRSCASSPATGCSSSVCCSSS